MSNSQWNRNKNWNRELIWISNNDMTVFSRTTTLFIIWILEPPYYRQTYICSLISSYKTGAFLLCLRFCFWGTFWGCPPRRKPPQSPWERRWWRRRQESYRCRPAQGRQARPSSSSARRQKSRPAQKVNQILQNPTYKIIFKWFIYYFSI